MKNNSTTKYLLSSSFFNRTAINFFGGESLDVILSIETENGSGHDFNVTGYKDTKKKTIFVTTVD
jgi:hypothetical protein